MTIQEVGVGDPTSIVMGMSAENESNALRAEGNALYKSMKLSEAINKYAEAAKLTPKSPIPLRNLSAAYFEAGKYQSCKLVAEKAIKLENSLAADDSDVQIGKLEARIERAGKFECEVDDVEAKRMRMLVLERLGKYKGSLLNDDAYFTVGHDSVLSIFDEKIKIYQSADECVSLFFGGIGDARNLFYTMIRIAELEKKSEVPTNRYHFTINDHNVNVLARDLIIVTLIQDLSNLDTESEDAVQILSTIYFVYNATMLPRYAFNHLQAVIQRLLDILREGNQPLSWFYIYDHDRTEFISAFESWSGAAISQVNNSDIIKRVRQHGMMTGPSPFAPPGFCETESTLYNGAALLVPPKLMLKTHDPGLEEFMKKTPWSADNAKKYRKYLKEHWNFNATLVDSSFGTRRTIGDFDFGHDPFQLAHCLDYSDSDEPKHRMTSLYDHVAPFFVEVSKSMKHLKGRIQIEAISGDCGTCCEMIRHGLYESIDHDDNEGPTKHGSINNCKGDTTHGELIVHSKRSKDFPDQFDRIHLSNVPDYIGGHLSTFLDVAPLLKKSPSSYVTANCLRNSASFECIEDYLTEYQLITSAQMLEKLCQIRIVERGESFFPMAAFSYYGISSSIPHPFSALLPREQFLKWFYSLFFKLVLPMLNDPYDVTGIIFAPLNLTIIPRLVVQLVQIGYPAHWLAECLQNIITNNVVTTGRPPRNIPLKPAHFNRRHTLRKLETSPFIHELSVILATFAPLLPFSLSSPPITLPSLKNIYRYSFHLPNYDEKTQHGELTNCVALLFWDKRLIEDTKNTKNYMQCIRPLLDPSWDEVDSKFKDPAAAKVRAKGIILYTSMEWDIPNRVASAWMEKSVVDGMDRYWVVTMVRTDTWVPIGHAVATVNAVTRGQAWSEGVSELVDATAEWDLD